MTFSNWFKFIFIPLIIFIMIFIGYFIILLGLIGCGYDSSRIQGCIRTSYYLYVTVCVVIIYLGYISRKYTPVAEKNVLSVSYNFIFSTLIFIYIILSKLPFSLSIKYSLLFFFLTCLGVLIFRTKDQNRKTI